MRRELTIVMRREHILGHWKSEFYSAHQNKFAQTKNNKMGGYKFQQNFFKFLNWAKRRRKILFVKKIHYSLIIIEEKKYYNV